MLRRLLADDGFLRLEGNPGPGAMFIARFAM